MANGQHLNEAEVNELVNKLDHNKDGCISYSELERELDRVHAEIAPEAKPHHLHHDSRGEEALHVFLRSLMTTDKDTIPAAEFKEIVRIWDVPSKEQGSQVELEASEYMKRLSLGRRLRAYWSVKGPEIVFIAFVASVIIALGVWQSVKYSTTRSYQAAFGRGVGLAKTCAGALYGTLFFMVLSMSRWFSTFLRRFPTISRFVNWDLSQSFHIKMSVLALCLATLHAIGHLSGSFVFGSMADRQIYVAALLGPDAVPRPYIDYVRALPGWSGLTALGLFWTVAALSMPIARKRSYELFQLGHLLMFPMLGLLCAHGTAQLLQWTMLGYFLAFPTLLILLERSFRILVGFHRISAHLEILDQDTVCITATIPPYRLWPFKAGQYILLQVPQISLFQWHPFTVSTCIGNEMVVHIKTDGDWTSKLRSLTDLKYIGVDGPFGAPAQRFYDFDQTIVVGAGIGVTPFSGILNDLQTREDHRWASDRRYSTTSSERTPVISTSDDETIGGNPIDLSRYRRCDFHWIVRDKNYLLWFSDLLNRIASGLHDPHLDVRLHTHVTQKRTDIGTHVYRWLLEKHRTKEHPASPLTGLINPTHFGRPDLPAIMEKHYEEMLKLLKKDDGEKEKQLKRQRKVGVFFCGAPVIGAQLADLCQALTLRGREDRSMLEYRFMIEVFG